MHPPSLQLHSRGTWFTRWGGGFYYFGRDRAEAQAAHRRFLRDRWLPHAEEAERSRPIPRGAMLTIDLAVRFIDDLGLRSRPATGEFYRYCLRLFLEVFGEMPVSAMHATLLAAHLEDLAGPPFNYSAKTRNHILRAIRTMFQWGEDMDLYNVAPKLRGVRPIRLPPPMPTDLGIDGVLTMLALSSGRADPTPALIDAWNADQDRAAWDPAKRRPDPRLEPWLALNYLCALRPSEVGPLVRLEGQWLPGEPGVFILTRSKTGESTGRQRRVYLSDEALAWLDLARPVWSLESSYSHAARRACGPGGPHPLRSTAATQLRRLGVDWEDVRLLLGHSPLASIKHYVRSEPQLLRDLAGRLTLGSFPAPCLASLPPAPPRGGRRRRPAPEPAASPLQWDRLRARHPGIVLLFQLDDVYEPHDDDAPVIAAALGPMGLPPSPSGIPAGQLDDHLRRFLAAGLTIGVCDLVRGDGPGEEPIDWAISRILSPPTPDTPGAAVTPTAPPRPGPPTPATPTLRLAGS